MRRSSSLHSIDDLIQRNISNDKYENIVTIGENIDALVSVAVTVVPNVDSLLAINVDTTAILAAAQAAQDAATAAEASNLAVAALYDLFDDRFLGSKDAAPITDNDGDPLIVGAIYWDTVQTGMFVWDGSIWTGVLTVSTVSTLTNKTLDDISNYIGANHIHYPIRNESGALIPKGTVITGHATQPGTDYIEVKPRTLATEVALGIAHTDIANNDIGLAINTGVCIDMVDTSLWDEGTILYPNITGGLTEVKPTSGMYQACAVVTRSHANQGTLIVEFSEPTYIGSTTQAGILQLVDDLITNDNTKALTAAQGKVLKDSIDTKLSATSVQALHATNALEIVGNILYLHKADGTSEQEDLSIYIDDTNLARIISGTYVIDEPLAGDKNLKFVRDDASVFYIDASMFFDDTNLVLQVDGQTGNVDLSTVYEPADATILKDADIGVTVQGYDVDTTKNDVANVFTAAQRTSFSTEDNLIDFTTNNDFKITLGSSLVVTVSNVTGCSGQSGVIIISDIENIAGWSGFTWLGTTPTMTTGVGIFGYKIDGTTVYIAKVENV